MHNKRIGLMVLSIGNFGSKGFYNLQEVGLAKALDPLFAEVLVYRLVNADAEETIEPIQGCKNATLHLLPSKQMGSNGIPDMRKIDASIDTLVCFSDTQVMFPSVYKWCQHNKIKLIPYIGVSKSHSNNAVKQTLINLLFARNLSIYKKVPCLVKTPSVEESLRQMGVSDIEVAPVGLDVGLMNTEYTQVSVSDLKTKYGYKEEDRVVLFVGRMTHEKQPERMIRIFKQVFQQNENFRLLMVGSGELSETVKTLVSENGLDAVVTRIERIPNKDIWELYRIADCFVNLNQQEIYGMVLLEAMYYGCTVIAWNAPGPNYIIDDGYTGYLVDSDEMTVKRIAEGNDVSEASKAMISKRFLWEYTAGVIDQLIGRN